jgi:hypothetical protein
MKLNGVSFAKPFHTSQVPSRAPMEPRLSRRLPQSFGARRAAQGPVSIASDGFALSMTDIGRLAGTCRKISSEHPSILVPPQTCASIAAILGSPSPFKGAVMNVKLVIAATALVVLPAFAQAQGQPPNLPKPPKAEVQKVVQIVSGDKAKTQAYCQIAKLSDQMATLDPKKDEKKLDELGKQADDLAQKIGPEYVKLTDELGQIDENSPEAKEFAELLAPLDKLCGQ